MKGYKITRKTKDNAIISIRLINTKGQCEHCDSFWYSYFVKHLDNEMINFINLYNMKG